MGLFMPLCTRVSYQNPVAVEAHLACYPEIEGFIEAAWPALVECFDDSIDWLKNKNRM
jgi:hypothetical protein